MKTITLPVLLLGLCFAAMPSSAGQIQIFPAIADEDNAAKEQQTPVPLAPRPNLFADFRGRLEAAVKSRDFAEMRALYQTNGIAPGELERELTRWRQLLAQEGQSTVSLYFKELGALPPTARQVWGNHARKLTTHEVTHLAFFRCGTAVSAVLPLVLVEGRLLIVAADKVKLGSGIEPGGAASGSQPIRSKTNRTSSAAGSHR